TPLPFPRSEGAPLPVQPPQEDLVVTFAEQFTALQGKFAFCTDTGDLRRQLATLIGQQQWTRIFCIEEPVLAAIGLPAPEFPTHPDLATCDASVTSCELLVARTGSLFLSASRNGRTPSVYAPVHLCVAYTSQLVYDISDGLTRLQQTYGGRLPSLLSLATGPSRTADIEKTLVVGVHGPKEVYCFLVDDLAVTP
ncbi:MAG TPA: lactate utilization protein, partial [Chitinophagaceae bacterium]|nr:lactate utilization protein [Chitinophagaceae bacterium]